MTWGPTIEGGAKDDSREVEQSGGRLTVERGRIDDTEKRRERSGGGVDNREGEKVDGRERNG